MFHDPALLPSRVVDSSSAPAAAPADGSADRPPIRISTRLLVALMGTVLLVMAGYMVLSHHQRRALLAEGMVQEVERLGGVLQVSAVDMLQDGRTAELDELLRLTLQSEEVFAAVVLDGGGAVVAGDVTDLACLRRQLGGVPAASRVGGWADCGAGVRWVALPLHSAGGTLVVGLEEVLLDRAVAAALQRQLLLIVALVLTLALAIVAILRRVLSRPLDRIMARVHALASTGTAPPLRIDRSAGELVELAAVLNDTVAQLQTKRAELIQRAEEQLALERRLRESERFATIGRLSGGLAHELGSPLSVIGMRAEVIQARQDAPVAVREQAATIQSEVARMSTFIQGLLHISRRQGIVFRSVELVEVVHAVAAELAGHAKRAHVALHVDSPPGPLTVRGQHTLLHHALRNLVRNAIQALREHPGERTVRIHLRTSVHEARIVVEDTGPGIPEEGLKQVLEPFYTTKSMGDGIGLGLPISHGIIEEHGGELSLENRARGGLRAVITLPLLPHEPRQEFDA